MRTVHINILLAAAAAAASLASASGVPAGVLPAPDLILGA
jgi:hypothetical protein